MRPLDERASMFKANTSGQPNWVSLVVLNEDSSTKYIFLTKTKRYSFIQIDRVHRYNNMINIAKNVKGEFAKNSQHPS